MTDTSVLTSWLQHTADELGMTLDLADDESVTAVLGEVDRRLAAYEPATPTSSPIVLPALPGDIAEEVPEPELPTLEKVTEDKGDM